MAEDGYGVFYLRREELDVVPVFRCGERLLSGGHWKGMLSADSSRDRVLTQEKTAPFAAAESSCRVR
jgi:hypothetical protein